MNKLFASPWLALLLSIVLLFVTVNAGIHIKNGVTELTEFHTPTLHTMQLMEADALEGIEEALAYTLLNADEKKEGFFAKMADFDENAKVFQDVASIQDEERVREAQAYEELRMAKANLVEKAQELFDEFDRLGVTSSQSVGAFEGAVNDLTAAFNTLVEVQKQELDEHVGELERSIIIQMGIVLTLMTLLVVVLALGIRRRV